MAGKFKLLVVLLFVFLKSNAQCDDYGSIVISEIYFDTHYTEDITSKYHSFGEYIELYNSSNEPIDLTDWVIKDNHTQFKFTVNTFNPDVIIKPGGYKIITYNGFYANPAYPSAGNPSVIGGRNKFKELFPQAIGHDEDIILQNTMVLFNYTDKVSLYNSRGRLVDEVSYMNNPYFNPTPTALEYMGITDYTYVVTPWIGNDDGGVFNGQMGMAPTYNPITRQPILDAQGHAVLAMNNSYIQAIYRSQPANYYTNGGKAFQNAVTTPFSLPFPIPLKEPDPRLFLASPSDENLTEEMHYDIKSGSLVGHSVSYFDELGKPTVSLNKDFETGFTWGSETTYDAFGRQSSTSFPAVTCFGMEKVNFMTEQSAHYDFLLTYYSNNNNYEPYQATATHPYSTINYDKLNPGNVINAVGGNMVNGQWKTDYTFTVPAAQEMYYVYGYGYYDGPVVAGKEEIITKFFKTVTVDANGEENVVFSDGEGKVLATARTGGTTYPVHSLIGSQGYIDVHIPKGITAAQITLIGGGALYDVYDLKTGLAVPTTSLIGGNAYRVQAKITPLTDPKVYVTNATNGVLSYDTGARGISYRVNYYDYSVNIYDKVGQLVKYVQPNGYQANTSIKATPAHMAAGATSFAQTYKYNALGQVVESTSPDEGTSKFVYRNDGQIRYSQSAFQNNTRVSYTDYDAYGRPIESGVLQNTWANATADPDGVLLAGTRTEQVFSIYDYADNFTMTPLVSIPASQSLATLLGANIQYYKQNNLAGNVAMSFKKDGTAFPAITWYSYDIYGRVEWMVQYHQDVGAKTINYEYDYKGNVTKVLYQKNQSQELFAHRYTYDLNNVLKKVETSVNNTAFTTHADYSYYISGELKRVNTAQGVQGTDYVYTLGGMLKSINHPSLEQSKDPGGDANDLFGMTLDYYAGDYTRAGTNVTSYATVSGYNKDQYNGNIKAVRWANKQIDLELGGIKQKAYLYNYNRNNWLSDANFGDVNGSLIAPSPRYGEGGIGYDPNGNIQSLSRTNHQGTLVDRLSYNYMGSNRLNYITENAAVTADLTDIENQSLDNYRYDAIGRLRDNILEGLKYEYNTQNLVTAVLNSAGKPLVAFDYNERGQRIRKRTFNTTDFQLQSTDYYVLDVSGNVMSIYTKPYNDALKQKELPIYGLKRLGVFFKADGASNYEITDHLGNVRAVIRKTGSNLSMPSFADYYPFGEKLPVRNLFGNYRYAFQGQELDTETGMEAFQLRLWDGRIGRWLSPDPYRQYSSPYLGMGNNPIGGIDRDGGFWEEIFNYVRGNGYISNEGRDFLKSQGITDYISLFSKTPTDSKGFHTVSYSKGDEVYFHRFRNVDDLAFDDAIGFRVTAGAQGGFNLSKTISIDLKLFAVKMIEWDAYKGWYNIANENESSMDFLSAGIAIGGFSGEFGFNVSGPKNQGLAHQNFSGHIQGGYTEFAQAGYDWGNKEPERNGFYTQHGVKVSGGIIVEIEFFCLTKMHHGLPPKK
ncbi:lamin tail domain-containing protein [Flavobacterium sp. PLA-1-15]|uniref:lamin tail domain-containing protein n=1 Tax=Flavobacterium sp. PLA-1-15 TaxID=3380533 RepID=UPI003B7D9F64